MANVNLKVDFGRQKTDDKKCGNYRDDPSIMVGVIFSPCSSVLQSSDVKLNFFSKSKLESKKSIKTRNLFLIVS